MKAPIVIIGIGELAGVFSHGFLRCGHPVYPITREMDISREYKKIPTPELVLLTVQEHELHPVLKQLPADWLSKVGLLQNELLPRDWQQHDLTNPTVTIVWFEKKKGLELSNILYSPTYGPAASLISNALQAMDIPAPILENKDALLYELVRKAVYILTVNIAGLLNNCSVEDLWHQHQPLATEIAKEVILILESLTGKPLPQKKLINGMVEGIKDCPHRHCLGRSALARLERALKYAQEANIDTPRLSDIYKIAKPD
jgi:ketopantoate reductase